MRRVALSIVVFATILVFATSRAATPRADDFEVQISPHIGYGLVRLSDKYVDPSAQDTRDLYEAGLSLGVATPIGLVIESGFRRGSAYSAVVDGREFALSNVTLAVGYQFENSRGFRLVPKVGRNYWRLNDIDRDVFNTTIAPRDQEGYDYFWELGLMKRVRRSSALGLTVGNVGFEFGHVATVNFTATFGF